VAASSKENLPHASREGVNVATAAPHAKGVFLPVLQPDDHCHSQQPFETTNTGCNRSAYARLIRSIPINSL
jgi:hypothetical protein